MIVARNFKLSMGLEAPNCNNRGVNGNPHRTNCSALFCFAPFARHRPNPVQPTSLRLGYNLQSR
jgi:hypothetical protein